MRTTLDLPVNLLNKAVKLSNHRTKTAVIIEALEEFIRKQRIQGLKKFKGKVKLDVDLDVSRNRK
jgi:hypothetical protein